ncbi:MAG: cytochrome c biogenesis protein ResB [Desulfobacteraceae bacterium]|nr:cytochrome c biogenesis protein ResB [Desulfobacteraceae bacterium]MBC2756204.1 cytochrome c biogenesis protein ResB [Desulfobacteraceae bacterium]
MAKPSNSDYFTHRMWTFFASVKLSVVILLSLAVTSIIGTVIPQNENLMLYHQKFGDMLFKIFNTLDIFDMYHSWWFRFLLCMLTVNIIVCSINRLSSTWKIIFPKKPSFNINRFRKAKNHQEWSAANSPEVVKNAYTPWLSKRWAMFKVESSENGYLLFGEKGRWTRLGVYAVHLSIILMVAGGLVGSIFGFNGFVNIPEGESVDSIFLRNNQPEIKLDFEIKCDDFNFSLYESGMPKEYRSSLSIIKNNQTVVQKDILVNDPLRFEGINIFQSSYGKMPATDLTVTFTEKASGLIYKKEATMGTPIEMPGNSGTFIVEDFRPNFSFRGVNLSNTFLCKMIPGQGDPEHIIIPADFPRFDMMRQGDFVISISNADFKYYTGLQVTKDPGVPLVYAGFLFMIIGCYVTFFMFHQKICIEISAADGKTSVMAAGISGRNRPGMNAVIRRLSNQLKKLS